MKFLLWLGCAFPVFAQQVLFKIDMRESIQNGWFDPTTEQIGIRGDQAPLSWAMTQFAADENRDGVYEHTLTFDRKGKSEIRIAYKFKAEGNDNPNGGWETDGNRGILLKGENRVIERAFNATGEALPPSFSGNIVSHPNFPSRSLVARDLFVYLPPDYGDNPQKRYPVLYMHDGRNAFDSSIIGQEWGTDEAAESLIRSGKMASAIIVGVQNTPQRIYEYTPDALNIERMTLQKQGAISSANDVSAYQGIYRAPQGEGDLTVTIEGGSVWFRTSAGDAFPHKGELEGNGRFGIAGLPTKVQFNRSGNGEVRSCVVENLQVGGGGALYGKFLVEEVKPLIDRTYRTKPDSRNTFVGGSSLGGLISMSLGVSYPNIFGGLLVVSPSVWWNNQSILKKVREMPRKPRQKIWLDMGTSEGTSMVNGAEALKRVLLDKGWRENRDFVFRLVEGAGHNEVAWAARMPDMLLFLFKK